MTCRTLKRQYRYLECLQTFVPLKFSFSAWSYGLETCELQCHDSGWSVSLAPLAELQERLRNWQDLLSEPNSYYMFATRISCVTFRLEKSLAAEASNIFVKVKARLQTTYINLPIWMHMAFWTWYECPVSNEHQRWLSDLAAVSTLGLSIVQPSRCIIMWDLPLNSVQSSPLTFVNEFCRN